MGLRSDRDVCEGNDTGNGGGTCADVESGKVSGEGSDTESDDGDEGSGDDGVCLVNAHDDVLCDDCPGCFQRCVIVPFQVNGDDCGGARWNGSCCHFLCHPSS